MTFSLLIGTLTYIGVQFLWYSPWVFGPLWRKFEKRVHVPATLPLALPTCISPTVRTIWLPAITVSVAMHVFWMLMEGFGVGNFLLSVYALWFGVVMGKYLRKQVDVRERKKWYIEDGALLFSLYGVAVTLLWWNDSLVF